MMYSVHLDERQYAMLCADAVLLSANGRHEVWSALPVSGRWLLRATEPEAVEMRDVFRIRGMTYAVVTIDRALAAPRDRVERIASARKAGQTLTTAPQCPLRGPEDSST